MYRAAHIGYSACYRGVPPQAQDFAVPFVELDGVPAYFSSLSSSPGMAAPSSGTPAADLLTAPPAPSPRPLTGRLHRTGHSISDWPAPELHATECFRKVDQLHLTDTEIKINMLLRDIQSGTHRIYVFSQVFRATAGIVRFSQQLFGEMHIDFN